MTRRNRGGEKDRLTEGKIDGFFGRIAERLKRIGRGGSPINSERNQRKMVTRMGT